MDNYSEEIPVPMLKKLKDMKMLRAGKDYPRSALQDEADMVRKRLNK